MIDYEARPTIVDAPLTLIFKMGQRWYHILFCLSRRPEIHLWLSATYLRCDYPGHRTKNYWHSIDAHFNLLCRQYLLPSINIWNIFQTYCLPFCPIETQPVGKAVLSNILAQAYLILPQLIYLSEYYILPARVQSMNNYPHATAHYSAITFL